MVRLSASHLRHGRVKQHHIAIMLRTLLIADAAGCATQTDRDFTVEP